MPKVEWNYEKYLSHGETLALDAFRDVIGDLQDQITRIESAEASIINNATIKAREAKDKKKPFII